MTKEIKFCGKTITVVTDPTFGVFSINAEGLKATVLTPYDLKETKRLINKYRSELNDYDTFMVRIGLVMVAEIGQKESQINQNAKKGTSTGQDIKFSVNVDEIKLAEIGQMVGRLRKGSQVLKCQDLINLAVTKGIDTKGVGEIRSNYDSESEPECQENYRAWAAENGIEV